MFSVGTCFQVAPGVLVAAWHVLKDIGAAAENAELQVDPLAGGTRFEDGTLLAAFLTRQGMPTAEVNRCGHVEVFDRG